LAKLGDDSGNRNHLATVFADGNAIGSLFGRVVASGDPEAKKHVSRAVSQATRRALAVATRAVLPEEIGSNKVPVIPHVVGGDDLLVSVVADRAWQFVTTYLSSFEQHLLEDPAVHPFMLNGTPPSASAGVVFAHATFPFRRAVELSEAALKHAKREQAGRFPAVAWLDVTQDGEHAPEHRVAWKLEQLLAAGDALRQLRAEVPPSGRAVLERLIDPADPALSKARIGDHMRRLNRHSVVEPFLGGGGSIVRLADALSLVRWWR
jgi:hypothetical protein